MNIYTVGNFVKIPAEEDLCRHEHSNELIFVGKMNYEPNVVAVKFFAEEVFPILKPEFPELKFTIVGAHPDKRVTALAESSGIEVTGFVDSIKPYFNKAAIVVAPMLTGAGIQNKIIQAMSYGCCVATTSIGAEGLSIQHDEIAIVNTVDEWITAISLLLNSPERRKQMGGSARQYVIENLSPEVISRQFWQFIDAGFH